MYYSHRMQQTTILEQELFPDGIVCFFKIFVAQITQKDVDPVGLHTQAWDSAQGAHKSVLRIVSKLSRYGTGENLARKYITFSPDGS